MTASCSKKEWHKVHYAVELVNTMESPMPSGHKRKKKPQENGNEEGDRPKRQRIATACSEAGVRQQAEHA